MLGYRISLLALLILLVACENKQQETEVPAVWYTWGVMEPDKAASTWLLKRFIAPAAEIVVLDKESVVEGSSFDVPTSEYRRTHDSSAYESLMRAFLVTEEGAQQIGLLIHDIEINLWRAPMQGNTDILKLAIANAEKEHGAPLSLGCYVELFDRLHDALGSDDKELELEILMPLNCPSGQK